MKYGKMQAQPVNHMVTTDVPKSQVPSANRIICPDSDEEDEKKPQPWECPIELASVSDLNDPIIVDSLVDDRHYTYKSKKAMKNFRQFFEDAVELYESLEFQ